jgi:twinfilin-like protein
MSFQAVLNELDAVIDPRTPLYLFLRRNEKLAAVTFVPYLAKESERAIFLEHRHDLVKTLGQEHFSQSLICKEVGEVTDARSWTERDEHDASREARSKHVGNADACNDVDCKSCSLRDMGYKRNKCRLCDRRMKNKITPEALDALLSLKSTGDVVQMVSILPL